MTFCYLAILYIQPAKPAQDLLSLPNHDGFSWNLKHISHFRLDDETDSVVNLQKKLQEKDMKLTDIQLEALSSAHQLEQLRETMSRMKV